MNAEELTTRLTAITSVQRLRTLANLAEGTVHVSELALGLSEDGKARATVMVALAILNEFSVFHS